MTERCPVHDITDCSPLLNGCSRLPAWQVREAHAAGFADADPYIVEAFQAGYDKGTADYAERQRGSGWSGGFEAGYRKATEDYEAKIRRVFEEMGIS